MANIQATAGHLLTTSEMVSQWLFNLELECSGASLNPLESIAIGGAILSLPDLLTALKAHVARMQELEEVLAEADRVIVWESFGLTNTFADRVEALLVRRLHHSEAA